MRQAAVLYNKERAGVLTQHDDASFTFAYDDAWYADASKPAISFSFPKSQQNYHADYFFPFFFHLLPEGKNRVRACKYFRIDIDDDFGLLMTVAQNDTIGAITVKPIC